MRIANEQAELIETLTREKSALEARANWNFERCKDALARAEASESALREALDVLEFYAAPFEYIKKHGLEEQTPDFYDELDTGERARAFIEKHAPAATSEDK
jgi:hypothetical protein